MEVVGIVVEVELDGLMGTVVARKRKDGTVGYSARIVIKQGGGLAYREGQTFDRQAAALSWIRKRETELAEPGGMHKVDDPALSKVIDQYIAESRHELGRTKKQVLATIKCDIIADMKCSQIGSTQIIAFAARLKCKPQTVQNYLSHLGAVFAVAKPAWGYPLDQQAMRDSMTVGKKMGITGKSTQRERRPTLDELNAIMAHFGAVRHRRPNSIPMQKITAFALFSTRRLEETARIRWDDLEPGRVLVRDMKNPGDKMGNHIWCDLPPEAEAIARSMPRTDDRIFPFGTDGIGLAFTRAGQILGIEDLHMHDLRHHGCSRLFEMGMSIPQVAAVSGHRSWQSLKRYTHMRKKGDCMEGWEWLPIVTAP